MWQSVDLGLILQPLVHIVFQRRSLLSVDENVYTELSHYKVKFNSGEGMAHLPFSLES
jgi:hypothetical protein